MKTYKTQLSISFGLDYCDLNWDQKQHCTMKNLQVPLTKRHTAITTDQTPSELSRKEQLPLGPRLQQRNLCLVHKALISNWEPCTHFLDHQSERGFGDDVPRRLVDNQHVGFHKIPDRLDLSLQNRISTHAWIALGFLTTNNRIVLFRTRRSMAYKPERPPKAQSLQNKSSKGA